MKKLLLALLFSASVMAMDYEEPLTASYSPDGYYYYIHNASPRWAACRVSFPNGMWQDFWIPPNQSTQWIPYQSAWYCEIR